MGDQTFAEGTADELPAGTELLHGQYKIVSFLNAGGFGITYRAVDSLDRPVVIKECFPGAFCRRSRAIVQPRSRAHTNEFDGIVRLFVEEARSLSKLQHPNIVGVHQVFEENDTAYMALDFVEGRDLLDILEDPSTDLPPDQIVSILDDMLDAVRFVHGQGMLHRDISPDNILIDGSGKPVLIDFGAARQQAQKQSRVLSAMRVVKDGYSPQEFYITGSEQGPFSDLYALGASFYHLISREIPPDSQRRLTAIATGDPDPYVPLAGRFPEYDENMLKAIDKALSILPRDRMQSAAEWLAFMSGQPMQPAPTPARPKAAPANAPTAPKAGKGKLVAGVAVLAVAAGLGFVFTQGGGEALAPEAPSLASVAPAATSSPFQSAPEGIDETSFAVSSNDTPAASVETPHAQAEALVAPSLPEPEIAAPAAPEAETELPSAEPRRVAPIPEGPSETDVAAALPVRAPSFSARPALRPAGLASAFLPEPQRTPDAAAEPSGATILSAPRRATPADEVVTAELPQDPGVEAGDWSDLRPVSAELPGAEILPEPPAAETELLSTGWTLALPFPDLRVDAQGRSWVLSANGTPVADRAAFDALIARATDLSAVEEVDVTMGIGPQGGSASLQQTTTLATVYETHLEDGPTFRSERDGDGWTTRVLRIAAGGGSDLQVGDVVIGAMDTGQTFEGPTGLAEKIAEGLANDLDILNFAVTRDGSTWVASLALPSRD
ncbi:serine/threonine-protein kinase [Jannaschia seohaensis]|nr:serine/threonine-protein kinase [Jannaschia seohaensis]